MASRPTRGEGVLDGGLGRETRTDRESVVKVVSIGGASRSGSTLLALLLGRPDGSAVVGELRYVWSRGYLQNQLCGCGEPFRRCPFWHDVLGEAYGDPERVPIQEILGLHRSVSQIWHLPALLAPVRPSTLEGRVRRYLSHLGALCQAIHRISGADTLVDSSKLPTFCYLLTRVPRVDARLVHLVRDSRATAFSFMRKRRKPEIQWRAAYMRRFSPFESALDWNVLNVGMELVRRAKVPCELLRYEDLVRDPRAALARTLRSSADVFDFLADGEVRLTTNHTVSGNPLRFSQATLRIRPDTEWRDRMRGGDRYLVTAMTWPLLLRYGYREFV
jgi:hypothetical protein